MKRIAVLVNPAAGGGQGQRVWTHLEARLGVLCTTLDARLTRPADDIRALTQSLLKDKPECLVVVGGDGSLNHVVNTLVVNNAHQHPHLKLAFYNAGVGGDFVRQFPKQHMDVFLDNIVHNRAVTCDVGKITFVVKNGFKPSMVRDAASAPPHHERVRDAADVAPHEWVRDAAHHGRVQMADAPPHHERVQDADFTQGLKLDNTHEANNTTHRYFMNVASCGLSAHVVQQAEKSRASKKIAGRFFYLLHGILGLFSYDTKTVLIVADEAEPEQRAIFMTAICNGQYFGRKMHIAPGADVQDGLLDVVSFEHMSWGLSLWKLMKLYQGTHETDKQVSYQKVRSLYINPLQSDVLVEADGDIVGQLPARFEVLPAMVKVII